MPPSPQDAAQRSCGIILTNAGKRFNRDWIFRHLDFSFETGRSYAITGSNGSGKSTLLQAIAGSMHLSEGIINYCMPAKEPETGNRKQAIGNKQSETRSQKSHITEPAIIDPENFYQHLSIAAPYLDLVEEMTGKEFLHFHQQFKPLLSMVGIDEIFLIIGLEKSAGKQIRYYSSGMKQRLKLAQAVFADTPVLLLDEPCTNLDAGGYQLYHTLINHYCGHKLVIVSSNDEQEINFCTDRINIMEYK